MTSSDPELPADLPARRPAVGLRLATRADAAAITAIYNHEVMHSTATFDLVPRSLDEQRAWLAARSGAFAAIVATDGEDDVVGFASLSPYKERAAYRTTVEDSIYIRSDQQGRGVGKLLLSHLRHGGRSVGFPFRDGPHRGLGRRQPGAARVVRLRTGGRGA